MDPASGLMGLCAVVPTGIVIDAKNLAPPEVLLPETAKEPVNCILPSNFMPAVLSCSKLPVT